MFLDVEASLDRKSGEIDTPDRETTEGGGKSTEGEEKESKGRTHEENSGKKPRRS